MNHARCLPLVLALAGAAIPGTIRAHDGPGSHTHEAPTAPAAREMATAARNLWAALTPEQKAKMGYGFNDPLRHDWHFVPRARKGVPFKEMAGEQKALAHALLASGLSQKGFVKTETIISLEEVLHAIEQGRGNVRDPELYYFVVFGNPDTIGGLEPWGWRLEGHHLSLNFTIIGDKGVAGGPLFMGSNPAEVKSGPRQGLRVLGEEEDLGRQLVASLDDAQRLKAVIAGEAPKDILSFALRTAQPLDPAGIRMADLTAEQKETLNALIVLYAGRLRPELAGNDLGKIMKAGIDKVTFAWAGGLKRGDLHYYRVQGPTFLIEFDNTQGNGNHVHSVWRDFDGDFGTDLLKKHYESAAAEHGHGVAAPK